MSENRGLGKGLRALIPESSPLKKRDEQTRLPLQAIRLNRFQPRKKLNESNIQELANSIRESGLIYPLLVRKINQSGSLVPSYELVAGERRLRALQLLGEQEAPVIVREMPDQKALELSLVENLQREELNPVEEALAYQRLVQEFELTQEAIAAAVGKDRVTVANTLRLLRLPESVRQELTAGRLTLGHARALLSLESERVQQEIAQRVIREGLSVRQVEGLVRMRLNSRPPAAGARQKGRDPHWGEAENRLRRALGTQVQIQHGRSRGWIRIAYYSLKDLERLLGRLTGPAA